MVVSIHQPNFLPWYGLIRKIYNSDVFIIFDDVQFPIGKSHYGHRSRIRTNTQDGWSYLTVPTIGRSEGVSWRDIRINDSVDWRSRHRGLLYNAYHKSQNYEAVSTILNNAYNGQYLTLCKFNTHIILSILNMIRYTGRVEFSSSFDAPKGMSSAERILDLIQRVGGTSYISGTGPGSYRYIVPDAFKAVGIDLIYNNFEHPVYQQQFYPFIENLSVVDMLYNLNTEEIINFLKNG